MCIFVICLRYDLGQILLEDSRVHCSREASHNNEAPPTVYVRHFKKSRNINLFWNLCVQKYVSQKNTKKLYPYKTSKFCHSEADYFDESKVPCGTGV